MYDPFLRTLVTNPQHYDRMIGLIQLHNPFCRSAEEAANIVNNCIRGALEHGDSAIGMCVAYRSKGSSAGVRLFLEPIGAGVRQFDAPKAPTEEEDAYQSPALLSSSSPT
jgi:hypothetical protein